jgi:leader peptidase (prepilin peptidase)/N-methyltransferase
MPHLIYILFFFALGSCVGSFLNVVVWRLPRVEHLSTDGLFRGFARSWQALSYPPSHCPKCGNPLKWYDNLPVIGWLKLAGRCRFCKEPISMRYPIVEAITGLLFVLYYIAFFIGGFGPGLEWRTPMGILQYRPAEMVITEHWPIYLIDMILIGALVAATLIDAELFIIPLEIPWFVAPIALVEHAIWDRPGWPGSLNPSAPAAALAMGGGIGLLISFLLWYFGILPTSFADGGPLLEIDKAKLPADQALPEREYSPTEIRAEMRKEMLFLMPPLLLGFLWVLLTLKVTTISVWWDHVAAIGWLSGLLGSILGLLIGGLVVWIARILGSYGFGREAMGMGDVHLMAAVGAVIGPGPATVAFFIAPFVGIPKALATLFLKGGRELPLGPYLSVGTAVVMLFYNPIANYLSPGLSGLAMLIFQLFSSSRV